MPRLNTGYSNISPLLQLAPATFAVDFFDSFETVPFFETKAAILLVCSKLHHIPHSTSPPTSTKKVLGQTPIYVGYFPPQTGAEGGVAVYHPSKWVQIRSILNAKKNILDHTRLFPLCRWCNGQRTDFPDWKRWGKMAGTKKGNGRRK